MKNPKSPGKRSKKKEEDSLEQTSSTGSRCVNRGGCVCCIPPDEEELESQSKEEDTLVTIIDGMVTVRLASEKPLTKEEHEKLMSDTKKQNALRANNAASKMITKIVNGAVVTINTEDEFFDPLEVLDKKE